MKKILTMLMIVSLLLSSSAVFASEETCEPCGAGNEMLLERVQNEAEITAIMSKAFANDDLLVASRRQEYRFDANEIKIFANNDFKFVTIPLLSKDENVIEAGTLFHVYDVENDIEMIFKVAVVDNKIVVTNYTDGANESVIVAEWEKQEEYTEGIEASCEAKCNAIVSGLGCVGFCALFGGGFVLCQPICSAAMVLFCSDFCTPSGPWYPPPLPECGIQGLPDCAR